MYVEKYINSDNPKTVYQYQWYQNISIKVTNQNNRIATCLFDQHKNKAKLQTIPLKFKIL